MSKNEEMKLLDEHYKKYCEEMEIEFYKKFKIKLLEDERTMKEVITEFIIKYVDKSK